MQEEAQVGAAKFSAKDRGEAPIVEGRVAMIRGEGAVQEDVLYRMRDNVHKVIPNISTTFVGAMRGAFIPPFSDPDTKASMAIREGCDVAVRTRAGSLVPFVGAELV